MTNLIHLPMTRTQYNPNLGYLRQVILKDRQGPLTPVRVSNEADEAVTMFVKPDDLWTVGIDWGQGPYHFNDMTPFQGSRRIGFDSSYGSLGFIESERWELTDITIRDSIARLARHKAGRNGPDLFGSQQRALVRLLFAVPEALRNFTVQRAVAGVLEKPGSIVDISEYRGNGKALNSWQTWSDDDEKWPLHGIAVRHLRSPGTPPGGGVGGGKRGRR